MKLQNLSNRYLMTYFLKIISLILFTITSFLIIQEPIFSHGAKDDCSEECEAYYCPEIEERNLKEDEKTRDN